MVMYWLILRRVWLHTKITKTRRTHFCELRSKRMAKAWKIAYDDHNIRGAVRKVILSYEVQFAPSEATARPDHFNSRPRDLSCVSLRNFPVHCELAIHKRACSNTQVSYTTSLEYTSRIFAMWAVQRGRKTWSCLM